MLAFAGAACGGGGGEKSASALSDADLKEMVAITSDGLPWQLTGTSDTALSNEDAAQRNSDPQTWLKNYEEWGRTGGHSASICCVERRRDEKSIDVQTTVAAYESADGAGKAFVATTEYLVSDEALQRMKEHGVFGREDRGAECRDARRRVEGVPDSGDAAGGERSKPGVRDVCGDVAARGSCGHRHCGRKRGPGARRRRHGGGESDGRSC